MRFAIYALALFVFIGLASSGFAQGYGDKGMTGSANGDVASTLEALERKVNDAIQHQDSKMFLAYIDPNAWSVDAMGFTPASEFATMLKDVVMKSYSIEGYKVMMIDKDAYISTFTWKCEASYKGDAFPPVTYCSTVWAKRGKEWKAVFHQESVPMEAPPAPPAGSR